MSAYDAAMAVCRYCHDEMVGSTSCTGELVHVKRGDFPPVPYGSEPGRNETHRCHDCDALPGGFHHRGCDMEICPACGEQLISWRETPAHSRDVWTENHFCEPVTVWTIESLINGDEVPLLVVHDEDGDWQVLDGGSVEGREPVLTRVGDVADVHPSLADVLDLPSGWEAWRDTVGSAWNRAPLT